MSVLFAEMDPANVQNSLSVCGQKNQKPPQAVQPQQMPSPTSSSSAAALQLAFELSMLSLSSCNNNVGNDMIVNMSNDHQQHQQHQQQQQQQHQANMKACSNKSPSSSLSPSDVGGINGINSVLSNNIGLSAFTTMLPNLDDRSKKSQNMTECVPVPSSEHVAEIVGRQGCKIKALRAKTNTYIKTPVRGEEPVFVVTGRKEDVAKAKREILSAAEHFSLIRASRKPSLSGVSGGKGTPAGPPANIPGQITIQVRVPYRVVGLVVGPKGATIKHIQQQTHTYIVTPSRDKEPVFEVTGMPDNVQSARRQIEAHIALRTGNAAAALNGLNSGLLNGLSNSSNGLSSLLNGEDTPEILASLYKNGLGSLFGYLDGNNQQELYNNAVNACSNGMNSKNDMGVVNVMPSSAGSSTCSSNSSTSSQSSKSAMMTLPELINIWKRNDATPVDIDEGLGDSPQPNIWSMPAQGQSFGSSSSPTASVSPTDSLLASFNCKNNGMPPNGININALNNMVNLNNMKGVVNSMNGNLNGVGTILCGAKNMNGGGVNGVGGNVGGGVQQQRECMVCGDNDVSAALVPCGHNMFCLDCANRICASGESACPICSETVIQAIRIIA